MDDMTRKKAECIYGLLWGVSTDRTTEDGVAVSEARKLALSLIDKDGQRRGIEWAESVVPSKLADSRQSAEQQAAFWRAFKKNTDKT